MRQNWEHELCRAVFHKKNSLGLNDAKYKTGWSSISIHNLEAIIQSSEILIGAGVEVRYNYEQQLMAIIYLGQKKCRGKYDLHYAIRVALLWKDEFPIDASARFMLGALFLTHGIQTNDLHKVREGTKQLDVSSRLCMEYPMEKCVKMLRFVIVNANGLHALIPYERVSLENEHISRTQKFRGRLRGNRVYVRPFKDILAASVFDCLLFSEQEPLCEFNIALAYTDPILAINLERVRPLEQGILPDKAHNIYK